MTCSKIGFRPLIRNPPLWAPGYNLMTFSRNCPHPKHSELHVSMHVVKFYIAGTNDEGRISRASHFSFVTFLVVRRYLPTTLCQNRPPSLLSPFSHFYPFSPLIGHRLLYMIIDSLSQSSASTFRYCIHHNVLIR